MKVALITSWPPERCGYASNSSALVKHMPGVDFTIIEPPFTQERVMGLSQDCAVVHLPYERNLQVAVDPQWFRMLHTQGKGTVVTWSNAWPGDHQDDGVLAAFDAVITQDPAMHWPEKNWFYVPQGILEVPLQTEIKAQIGTAGFPNYWKGSMVMAEVAEAMGLKFLDFAPTSRHADAVGMRKEIEKRCHDCEFIHDFLPMEQIIWRLSECAFTCWFYIAHAQQSGVSGSVRLGLATKRPVFLSRAGMYRDLFKYEDEIHFIETDSVGTQQALDVIRPVWEAIQAGSAKHPNRVIEEMNWTKSARIYREVYEHVLSAA
jgi:hypothetical protein